MSQRSLAIAALLIVLAPLLRPALLPGADALRLRARASYLAGIPILIRVEALDASGRPDHLLWDAVATLEVASGAVTLQPDRIPLRNGQGSALVSVSGSGDFTLRATLGALEAVRPVRALLDGGAPPVSGELPSGNVVWSGIVRVTGDVIVGTATTLHVRPDTLVLLAGTPSGDDGTSIIVNGAIEVEGTESEPVSFTADAPGRNWGEIFHDHASPSTYRHAAITRGGHSPRGGHTNTGPTLRVEDSALELEDVTLSDAGGKAMEADDAELVLRRCHISRCVMGPEIDDSAVLVDECLISEMFGADDNDGIYIHSQAAGQEVLLKRTVVAAGDDDGIDTLGAEITVEDCIARDFADKGASLFHGPTTFRRFLSVDNGIGISAKTDDGVHMPISIDHATLAGNAIGIAAEDKNDQPLADIRYTIENSIIRASNRAIETDYDPSNISISFSDVEGSWPGEGNFDADPEFVDASARDFRLGPGSPCIDRGDPDATADADGSRPDLGSIPFAGAPAPRFVRGFIDNDDALDVGDAVTALFHLFLERPLPCPAAIDVDDDEVATLADVLLLLDYVFLEGPPPAAPFPACAADPTPGGLPCTAPAGC